MCMLLTDLMDSGMEFQMTGPATEKALSPSLVLSNKAAEHVAITISTHKVGLCDLTMSVRGSAGARAFSSTETQGIFQMCNYWDKCPNSLRICPSTCSFGVLSHLYLFVLRNN